MTTESHESTYRIGAVSRLTGIPPDTLRVWERRYNLVTPMRSEGGGRLYSQEDVTHLALVKRLVDSGHAIGTVAELTPEQLRQRIAEIRLPEKIPSFSRPLRLAILGATLSRRLQADWEPDTNTTIELVGSFQDRQAFVDVADALDADMLVVELPILDKVSAAEVRTLSRRCGASRTLAVFGFGSREAAATLERQGITALRFPVTWEEIHALAGAGTPPPKQQTMDFEVGLMEEPPQRIYDDHQLAIAATKSTSIKCECPRHLADLILSLSHFEAYSAQCENQNREDAALHTYLHVTSARARSLMEQALKKVVDVEGIDLNDQSAGDNIDTSR